ncbi:MAG TPA: Na+/galactose cotransporter [Terracidiphilus sp.]|nr:Na+/galactose cotransporter [Terracidiphilus sp.]
MPILTSVDWLIILLYFVCVLVIGFSLRSNIKTSKDFLQAGRSLPAWICALALLAASLGSQEIIAMGAAGARYGLHAALFFSLGAIPAMLFAAVYMMPIYYGSGARTVPEYLNLRFDRKTSLLNACTFAVTTLASAGISLYLMARIFQAIHVFDPLFYAYGWPRQGIFTFSILLPAAVVLVYVLFAGLVGAMVNQVLQFLLIVAGFLPMVLIGLKNIGGWSGLKSSLPAASPQDASAVLHTGAIGSAAIGLAVGFVLAAGRWSTDFRILQAAMAAKNIESARRIPLLASAGMLLLPFLLILPGTIAIGLPTPHSTTVVRNENGAIYHEITIVPPEASAGHGLVPARLDPATGNPQLDAAGQPQLNYDMATPSMLMHFLPTGLLGLGIAALLASLMSGLAASVTAFNAVFTCDVYQSCIRKTASDKHYFAVARWAAVATILLSIGVAYALTGFSNNSSHGIVFNNILYPLLLVFSLVNAPQLATFLLGMFTKRATGHGAFAGLVAGTAAALLHHGLTLPIDANPGLYGGWIAVVHRYPGFIAQCFGTAILAFTANLIVTSAVSLSTEPRPESELKTLLHSLMTKPPVVVWWKRPEAIAAAILVAAIAVGLFFA